MVEVAPSGWAEATYSEVAEINRESWSASTDPAKVILYLDLSAIPKPGSVLAPLELLFGEAPSRARRRVRADDILVSCVRPYLRSFAFVSTAPENLTASTGFAVLSPRENVEPRFLYQTIFREAFLTHLKDRMVGSNYPAVGASDIAEGTLPLPPLPEQRKIAEILGSVDEAIRATEAVIEQTRKVKEGLLQELLTKGIGHTKFRQTEIGEIPEGWEVRPLKDLAAFKTGKLDSNAAVRGGKYPFFTCAREDSQIDSFSFDQEALLLAGNNAKGEYSVKWYHGKFDAYQRTYVITANAELVTFGFLREALELQLANLTRLSTGSATKFLTMKVLDRLPIAVPPLEEQVSIAATLDHLAKTLVREEVVFQQLKMTKQGLLQDLLTGKVRVKV